MDSNHPEFPLSEEDRVNLYGYSLGRYLLRLLRDVDLAAVHFHAGHPLTRR
jgi:hypothetical protein